MNDNICDVATELRLPFYADSVGEVPCTKVVPVARDDHGLGPAAEERAGYEVSLGETDPTALGAWVVRGLRSSVRAVIDACVVVAETVRRFEGDRDSLDEFLAVLADGNVIPRRQARLGSKSSKLSKLRKIGSYAELLCRDEIIKHLEPGYTVNYHVTLLYEALPGDEQARMKRLVKILEAEGGLSREFLIRQTELAKQARGAQARQAAGLWDDGAVFESGRDFDLILLTPNRRDLQRLSEDYTDELPWCLRVHERVAEKASAVVVARLADLPTVANRLLPSCGFARLSHVLLLREPIEAEITEAQVVVLAERGRRESDRLLDLPWLPHDESVDFVSMAKRLVPDAANRLHVFAPSKSDSCCSIIGEANWSQSDE
jgi:hypothetical protein